MLLSFELTSPTVHPALSIMNCSFWPRVSAPTDRGVRLIDNEKPIMKSKAK